MADKKITALTAMSSLDTLDLAAFVDVSDTTMAGSGTDKKVTTGQLADTIAALLGLGTAATSDAGDFDAAGAAAGVATLLDAKADLDGPTFTGTATIANAEIARFVVVETITSPGSTVTFPAGVSNHFRVTLAEDSTIAFSGAQESQTIRIKFVQAASGGPWSPDWSGLDVTWYTADFAAPAMPTTAGAGMVVVLCCTGEDTYDGFLAGTSGP